MLWTPRTREWATFFTNKKKGEVKIKTFNGTHGSLYWFRGAVSHRPHPIFVPWDMGAFLPAPRTDSNL